MRLGNFLQRISGNKIGRIGKKWTFDVKEEVLAPPAACEYENGKHGIIYGTKDGKICLLDEDANLKWRFDIKERLTDVETFFMDEESAKSIYSTPALYDINNDGKLEIIVGSDSGGIYVISLDGKLVWSFKTNGPVRGSALVADINNDKKPEILFGSMDKHLYVLDSKGKVLWKYKLKTEIQSTPAYYEKGSLIIFGADDGFIRAITSTGKFVWKFKTEDKIMAQPVIGDIYNANEDFIVIGSLDKNLYVLTIQGQIKWKYETEGSIYSKACLADLNSDRKLEIVFGSCDDNVYVLSCNGDKIWSYETDFWVVDSPFVADIDNDGKLEIVVGSYDHSLYVFDAEGAYLLNYMPGVSGVMQQQGHYTDMLTSEPGQFHGKKLWQLETEGMIVGTTHFIDNDKKEEIVIAVKKGMIDDVIHKTN